MNRNLYALIFIMLLFTALLPQQLNADEADLQILIDEANPGETITYSGTYEGDVFIDKAITIDGEGSGVIQGTYDGTALSIEADDVTIKNMSIGGSTRSRSSEQEGACIRNRGDNNSFVNLTLSECYHGIYLNTGDNTLVEDNEIVGYGDGSRGDQGYGMYVKKSHSNTITGNDVNTFRDGLYFEYSDYNLIEDNRVSNTRYGLHYMYSNFNEFHHNDFVSNVGGAAVMQSDHILLENNTFSYNQGTQAFGLIVQTSRNVEVKNNDFVLNQRGLYIESSTQTEISGNNFFNNEIGVELWSSSTEQYFYDNDFISNTVQAAMVGSIDQHFFSKNQVGNYWGQPLIDLNQDGVGDDAFVYSSSVGNLIQHNELSYLFIKSPAMLLQENASRLFGMFDNEITDEFPQAGEREFSVGWLIAVATAIIAIIILLKWRKRSVIK